MSMPIDKRKNPDKRKPHTWDKKGKCIYGCGKKCPKVWTNECKGGSADEKQFPK